MRNDLDRIAHDIREANLQPHQWWSRIGGEALAKIAKQVLALTCSAFSCERNWSMCSFVHNKSQNCLGRKKAKALVYIFTNTRLLQGRVEVDPLRWYEHNVFSEDENEGGNDNSNMDDREEGVSDDSDMDDRHDDKNYYGAEGNEGDEPFNDDEGRDGEVGENIGELLWCGGNEGNVGIFDWNEIDAKIEERNQDHAQRLSIPRSEEFYRSYSQAPCPDRSSKDIESDENVVLSHNNNILSHVDSENENGASIDNKENNNNDEINGIVAPIIQNNPAHGTIEKGPSSKSIPSLNDNSDGNTRNSKRSMYAKPMDIDPPSIIKATCRNIMGKRAKGTIGVWIIVGACGASSSMIGEGGGMDDNVVVETNANQDTCNEMNMMDNGAVVTGDGMNTAVDANVVHYSHRTTSMPSSK